MLLPLPVLLLDEAEAFELRTTDEGSPVRWDSFPVPYAWAETEGTPPHAADAVHAAFATWTGVGGTPVGFVAEAPAPEPVSEVDAWNHVWFETDWPFDHEAIATTDVWYDDETGEMVAFDIRIDGNARWSTEGAPDAYDLQAALAHEAGHALGLLHSEQFEATMFAKMGLGEDWRRELAPDDVAGARALYEDLDLEAEESIESMGEILAASCATVPGTLPGAGTLALVATTFLARRRRGT